MMERMRRLFWMGVGAAAGASGTVWVQRRVRQGIEELGAEQVVAVAGRGARSVGRTVVAAVAEGRVGMAEREMELRQQMLGTEGAIDLRQRGARRRTGSGRRRGVAPAVSVRRMGR